jgi:hypothetical protein
VQFPDDQVAELTQLFPGATPATEGGVQFFLMPKLRLPDRCTPGQVDALLCPTQRDGYPSRLFVAEQVQPCRAGWATARILEHNWYAASWRTREGQRLAQMVLSHLDAFRS